MSVLRPRPPTDPIGHLPPPAARTAAGQTDRRWQAWLDRGERVRGDVVAACGSATETMLAAYGTTGSPARRRDSVVFEILDVARQIRESVDCVVVIGDRADKALVDLLLSTCCHPRHGELPRHERGGRPRICTLGPDDDDDDVQALLDVLKPRGHDSLLDAWGLVLAGRCRAAFTRDCALLLAGTNDRGVGAATPPAVVAETCVPSDAAPIVPRRESGSGKFVLSAPDRDGQGGVFTAASLLPAAIAGIDVVRLLEGAAAMARRFREAPAGANPVVSLAIVGRWLADDATPENVPRRRFLEPARWNGLALWHDQWLGQPTSHAPDVIVTTGFTTPISVTEFRRAPFAAIPRAGTIGPLPGMPDHASDQIVLPRCDEHTIGQLLEALRLAAAIKARLG
jgi:hypothetical protein